MSIRNSLRKVSKNKKSIILYLVWVIIVSVILLGIWLGLEEDCFKWMATDLILVLAGFATTINVLDV